MAEQYCSSCRFFRKLEILGQCRLYPTYQNKHERDWCGQYQIGDTPVEKPVEKVEKPVYDIVTDTFTEKPKRKYTRKQDAKASA